MKKQERDKTVPHYLGQFATYWSNFGPRYAMLVARSTLAGGGPSYEKLLARRMECVDAWLRREFRDRLRQYQGETVSVPEGRDESRAPIWICWLQGEEQAPPLVRRCIASVRRNAGDHPVRIVTLESIPEHVALPAHILEKFHAGVLSAAQLSDILRMSLLAEHGGLWLDATIYCAGPMEDWIFQRPVYTIRAPFRPGDGFLHITQNRWTGFALGGVEGFPLFRLIRDLFFAYWRDRSYLIDYFMIDYLIQIAYLENPQVHRLMTELPYNNIHYNRLSARMNSAYSPSEARALLKDGTIFFKLSHKQEHRERTPDGRSTFYGHLMLYDGLVDESGAIR